LKGISIFLRHWKPSVWVSLPINGYHITRHPIAVRNRFYTQPHTHTHTHTHTNKQNYLSTQQGSIMTHCTV